MSSLLGNGSPPKLQEVQQAVLALAAKEFGVALEKLTPNTRLIEDLGLDSLDVVEFIMEVEAEFGITIPDEIADQLSEHGPLTLGRVAEVVVQRWGTATQPVHSSGKGLAT